MQIICMECEDGSFEQGSMVCPMCHTRYPIQDWHFIFNHFHQQEQAMIDFLQYIPYEAGHRGIYSPKLFEIYFNIGAGIEQILRIISDWPLFNNVQDISLLRSKKKNKKGEIIYPNIGDFLTILNPFLRFKKHSITLKYPESTFKPFYDVNFKATGKRWPNFNIYSEHKHKWIEMKKEFKLYRTMRLLGAYFLLICLNPCEGNYEYLLSRGIMKSGETIRIGDDFERYSLYGPNPLDTLGLRNNIYDQWTHRSGSQILIGWETELLSYKFRFFHHGR